MFPRTRVGLALVAGDPHPHNEPLPTPGTPPPDPPPAAPAAPFPDEPGDQPAAPQPPPIPHPIKVPAEPEREAALSVADQWRNDLQELGDMTRRGIRFHAAFLEIMQAHSKFLQAMGRALNHLTPSDLDDEPHVKSMLADSILGAERALHAQTPPESSKH